MFHSSHLCVTFVNGEVLQAYLGCRVRSATGEKGDGGPTSRGSVVGGYPTNPLCGFLSNYLLLIEERIGRLLQEETLFIILKDTCCENSKII